MIKYVVKFAGKPKIKKVRNETIMSLSEMFDFFCQPKFTPKLLRRFTVRLCAELYYSEQSLTKKLPG